MESRMMVARGWEEGGINVQMGQFQFEKYILKISKEIITNIFYKLLKNINLYIQGQQTSSTIRAKKSTLNHTTVKTLKDKKKILKAACTKKSQ